MKKNNKILKRLTAAVLCMGMLFTMGACGDKAEENTTAAGAATEKANGEKVTLTVLAAASLTDVCNELTAAYNAKYPDVELSFSFAGSGALQTQIEEGAPADVFISAANKQMNALKEKIFLLENGYNDMACELSKLAVAEVVSKSTGQNVHDGYCTEIDRTENTITFQFFIGSDHRSLLQTTRYDVYQRSMRIVKEYFADIDTKKGFLNIDQSWAKEALRRYKTSD